MKLLRTWLRLQGLKRKGMVERVNGEWRLTPQGVAVHAEKARSLVVRGDVR